MSRALALRPAHALRRPQGAGLTYSAQNLPASFSAGGAPSVASMQQAQAQAPTSGTTYIIAGAVTTIALGALIYFATR
jgi:hypothetical protein